MEEAIRLLLTYGPGGLIAALVVLGVLVPKSYYDREIKRGDTATLATSVTSEAMKVLAEAVSKLGSEIGDLKEIIVSLNAQIRDLKEEVRVLKAGK